MRAHAAGEQGVAVRRGGCDARRCRSCRRRRRHSRSPWSGRATLPICSVTMRATTSLGPPAGNGTTTVIGRDGIGLRLRDRGVAQRQRRNAKQRPSTRSNAAWSSSLPALLSCAILLTASFAPDRLPIARCHASNSSSSCVTRIVRFVSVSCTCLEPAQLRHHRRHVFLHPRRGLALDLQDVVQVPGGIDAVQDLAAGLQAHVDHLRVGRWPGARISTMPGATG